MVDETNPVPEGTQIGNNENPTIDELEVIKARLEQETAAKAAFEAEIAAKDSKIAELETKVSRLSQGLEQSVSKYRDLVVVSNPHLADFIQGVSIDEIDASVEKARALVEKVKQAIEIETKRATVPAGAPARTTIPPEGMTSREKIVYGMTQRR